MQKRAKSLRAISLAARSVGRSQNCVIEPLEHRMLLTTVTSTQWMDAQVAPNINPANTLPTLSTFWPYAANVTLAQEMADRWGYNLKWYGYLTAESVEWYMNYEPTSTNYQIAMLVKNNPGKYKLSVALSKEYTPGSGNESHPESQLRDADGNYLGGWGPEMPDSVMQQWAMARADGILALESYGIPVNGVILNSGEYGPGFDETMAMKDPVVAAARGNLSWLDYSKARYAHYAQIISDAVRAAAPDRELLIMYTADPARDRGARWPQTLGDAGTVGYQFVYPWLSTNTWPMQSWSDVPAGESYFKFGWGSGGYSIAENPSYSWDMLSLEMSSFAQQQALGQTRSYYWLDSSHSDSPGPHAPKYDYMGYLKCLYTAGMLGAVEQTYGQGTGFNPQAPDASFDDAAAPRWLQSFTWQSQVYGEFTWLNDFITNSDLLPGPSQQRYSWDLPAYEFPAVSDNDRDVRILVRQAKDGVGEHKKDWLVTAWWASDTATTVTSKEVQVDIPGLGIVSVTARNAGSVYRIRKNTAGEVGIQFLDPNADVPSQNFTASGNVAPVSLAQSTHTQTGTGKGIKLAATDNNADLLTYTIVAQPGHGSLSGSGANLIYTPDAGYTGSDSFTFKASDGTVDSNIATLSLTVNAANAAPVAMAQALTTLINTGIKIQLAGTDTNGDILTYTVTGNPAHGTLSGSNGNLFYTPADNWFGSDSFSFVANDGTVNSVAASVGISIAAPTVIPTANIGAGQSTMYKRPGGDNTPQRVFLLSLWGNTVNYPVVVNYTVTGGTAISGVDYKPMSGRVVFRPGVSDLSIMTNVYDDAGGDKTLSVQLSPSSVYAISTATATETIYNDERPTATIADRTDFMSGTSSVSVTRGDRTSSFWVQMKSPPTTDRWVYFTVSGSAVEGVDYILPGNANHQVLIKANTLYSSIPIEAVDNGLVNGTKSLLITLTPDASYQLTDGLHASCYANIFDNPAGAQAAAPYGLVKPGTYDTAQTVSLASRTAGASIRYTLDGSTPSATNGILYTGSFVISVSTYVRAYAYKSGMADSREIGATYQIIGATPTVSWNSSTQMVTLSTTTPGASIYYTTDYTPPVTTNLYAPSHGTLYTGPFVIADPTRVRAVTIKSGLETSDTATFYGVGDNAQFVRQVTPATMTAGQTYSVSVTMKNVGDNTWAVGGDWRLGSQNARDNTTWGMARVNVTTAVAPGQAYTFTFNVTAPSTAGTYNFQWQMVHDYVAWFGDYSTNIAVTVGIATASYVTANTTTQGSWKDAYGSDGYNVIGDASSYPAYATVTPSGNGAYTWAASTTNAPALVKPASGSTDRIAACWYSATSMGIDVNITDGKTHSVAIYMLDWDSLSRAESIVVSDASSGTVLDTRSFSSFSGGTYATWNISGHVKFTVTNISPISGNNVVISGLFFGAAAAAATIPQSQMTATTTSFHTGYEASNVLDGNTSTFWHAEYSPIAPLPQSITLALGGSYGVTKLRYMPRQDGYPNGNITGYTFYTSTDGSNFTQAASGTWADDSTEKSVSISVTTASYVRLTVTAGNGGYASAAELNVEDPPFATAPSALTAAAASSSQINLAWTDNSSNETGFKIERATNSSFTQNLTLVTTMAANATSYSNTGLPSNTTYYYRVRATNGSVDTFDSNTASAATQALTTVTVAATTAAASETGPTNGVFSVTRIGTSGDLPVNYAITGSATSGSDYTALTGSVIIPNGQSSATVTVAPVNDTLAELTENVILTLSTNAAYTVGGANNAAVTIADNDTLDLPASLTALWRFDEGSGTTAYDTANGTAQNGTLTNGPTRVAGKIGNALQFNGTSQYVSVASAVDINPTAAVSLAIWAKADAGATKWNASQTFLSKRNAYILGPVNTSTKGIQFQLYISGAWKTASYTPTFDITQWHHYAATYDGANMKLYIDGALVKTQAQTGTINPDTGVLCIGRDDGQPRYFKGTLDEARVYNAALAASSVTALYNQAALSVSSLTVSSGNSASYSVQSSALAVGANPYGDTTDTFTTIPGKYLGSTYLKTANADGNTTGSNLLSFTVNQPVTVYVVYSDSYTPKPGWMNDFTDTGDNIVTSKGTFSVYKKTVSAGTIVLGGNSFDGLTNNGMYSVLLSSVL